ncbi:hypothetical protein [Vibrio ouci]|uniref:Uncharacterized protein n=1 Tax=Vibrio ouci TaxID=2499078 RepID=A0A4Y8WD31_9VIBR|nr:hypothetical protein [Vibrio ouci]TFH90171.1 hypothetical protein ELS82_18115 [Vibrio ouci]
MTTYKDGEPVVRRGKQIICFEKTNTVGSIQYYQWWSSFFDHDGGVAAQKGDVVVMYASFFPFEDEKYRKGYVGVNWEFTNEGLGAGHFTNFKISKDGSIASPSYLTAQLKRLGNNDCPNKP